jgi:tetratricopeptide (TPR) repeat protein
VQIQGLDERFAAALAAYRAQRLAESEQLCRQILAQEADHPESLHLLGVIAATCGHAAPAVELIRRAIALRGDVADYHINLGLILQPLGELDAALREFELGVRLEPGAVEAQNSLAVLYLLRGRPEEAVAAFERVLALQPGRADASCNLGIALQQQGLAEPAIAAFQRALALRPDYAEAAYNLGVALQQQGRLEDAVAPLEQALALRPDYVDAAETLSRVLNNIGIGRRDEGRLGEAQSSLERALALRPDHPEIRLYLALIQLGAGDLRAGWLGFEARWRLPDFEADAQLHTAPRWDGRMGSGETILLWAEQGFGDTLQFCRYAPLVARRGWRVVVEVPRPLVRLLSSLDGVAVVPTGTADPAGTASQCPLMSLPLLFDTVVETIPAAIPYLGAASEAVERWRTILESLGAKEPGGLTVGLCWAGNPRIHSAILAATDAKRSIPLDRLGPLFRVKKARFVSLQRDRSPGDNPSGYPLIDPMAEVEDFADTAAILAALDLVITVDTAVAHLAGALGKPVWLLNRYDTCWRWLHGRSDSPWYPTLRQFRQPSLGDWDSAIAEVAAALADLG